MKKILSILVLLFQFNIIAQSFKSIREIDTLSIVYKAKLFTISQYKYESKKELFYYIDNLQYEIFGTNDLIFFKIKSRYNCEVKNDLFTTNLCACDYYICYSIEKDFFYWLGGFKTDDIKEFAKEYFKSTFISNWNYKIEDKKLSEFINYLNLHKIKKAINCFEKCLETKN